MTLVGLAVVVVLLVVMTRRIARLEDALAGLRGRIATLEGGARPARTPGAEPGDAALTGPQPEVAAPVLTSQGAPHAPPAHARVPISPPRTPGISTAQDRPEGESLESRIGSRWLLYLGVAAIVVGAAYFIRLAIDSAWLGERLRVTLSAAAGLALIAAGLRFARRGYVLYGQIVAGGGITVLYVAAFAAASLYSLVEPAIGFAAMAAITVLAAWLADRERSQGLALTAVGGGFATPFLLPGGPDPQLVLFSYDALLVAGTMALAHRRVWPALNVVSYVLTVLTIAAWSARFYDPSKYLATELFLTLFCALFVAVRQMLAGAAHPWTAGARAVLATAPLLFWVASLDLLWPHPHAFLTFIAAWAAVGALAGARGCRELHAAIWASAALPLLAWVIDLDDVTRVFGPAAVTVAVVYLLNLVEPLRAARAARTTTDSEAALVHGNALAGFCGIYLVWQPLTPDVMASVALLAAIAYGGLAWSVASREGGWSGHFVAVAAVFTAIAIGLRFEGPWLAIGWAAEGAALVALGLRRTRPRLRAGGAALLTGGTLALAVELAAPADATFVVLLNGRALAAAIVAALWYVVARWYGTGLTHVDATLHPAATAVVVANLTALAFISTEIGRYWMLSGAGADARFGREASLSLAWAIYATGLIVVGLWRRYAPVRYLGMGLFAITSLKVLTVDLAELDRLYRVLSILGLGMLLLVSSYLYNRFQRAGGAATFKSP